MTLSPTATCPPAAAACRPWNRPDRRPGWLRSNAIGSGYSTRARGNAIGIGCSTRARGNAIGIGCATRTSVNPRHQVQCYCNWLLRPGRGRWIASVLGRAPVAPVRRYWDWLLRPGRGRWVSGRFGRTGWASPARGMWNSEPCWLNTSCQARATGRGFHGAKELRCPPACCCATRRARVAQ